jgi:hypothetical protein
MPPAALAIAPLVGGALSAGGSASQGKKAGDAANKQMALQQQQLNFGRDLTQAGMGAWQPAANYWSTLLGGDRTAIQGAVGPSADLVRGSMTAANRTIGNSLPAGGERNLALAQANQAGYSQLGRLYAGVQPQAAAMLGQLSQIPIGAGVSTMGQGAPQVAAGLQSQLGQQGMAAQGMQGAGNLLYQGVNKARQGKGGGGSQGSVVPGGTGKES